MAGAVAVSSGKPGKRYNAKVTGYVWFLCLIGGSGGLLLGYDNGIIGKRPVLPKDGPLHLHCTDDAYGLS